MSRKRLKDDFRPVDQPSNTVLPTPRPCGRATPGGGVSPIKALPRNMSGSDFRIYIKDRCLDEANQYRTTMTDYLDISTQTVQPRPSLLRERVKLEGQTGLPSENAQSGQFGAGTAQNGQLA